MFKEKIKEIRAFCELNSDPKIIAKYSKYFKEGFDGFGIDDKIFRHQIEVWIEKWNQEMTIENYLTLGDELMKNGKFEEKALAIHFVKSKAAEYTEETFDRIGKWFDPGISNWATTDVLCMLVLPHFFIKNIIDFDKLKKWNTSQSEWQRRAVPVLFAELSKLKIDFQIDEALSVIEPLMEDESEYVQKGLGTLLRGLWKKQPKETEKFLYKWKDKCGRLIIRYATEKMDKEYRKKFRKAK
ncbi:MAG: DNA alkylation repair protein [Bacteroidetes bacterium]|nr:MAG: DNA alkylation repair protein [Bacteroidota bacterium]